MTDELAARRQARSQCSHGIERGPGYVVDWSPGIYLCECCATEYTDTSPSRRCESCLA